MEKENSTARRRRLVKPSTRLSLRMYARAYKQGLKYPPRPRVVPVTSNPIRQPAEENVATIPGHMKTNPIIVGDNDSDEEDPILQENRRLNMRRFAVEEDPSCITSITPNQDWVADYLT